MTMISLKDKVALITGGSKGIGSHIVRLFSQAGATVYFTARNAETSQSIVDEITSAGGSCYYKQADVADYDQCGTIVKEIIKEQGKIDILVNNAGITDDGLIAMMKKESWDKVLDINLSGVFNTCKAVMRPMMKKKYGRIINMSSVVGITGNPGQVNYASSKAGIIGFTKSLAKEVASRNITVNSIAPGYIKSDMTDELTEQQQQAMLDIIPMKRMGMPEDIANAALFLASPLADYITGTTLNVNGGMV